MTKIILVDGVINVTESYDDVTRKVIYEYVDWLEFTEFNREKDNLDKAFGTTSDRRICINRNHIQCIKL